ncbi:MAG: biopolymer transporter ExbD [Burkholderiaceae bacterium]|jgi:biopolymer transport protein TolR|nr:biopolymer transporter ExbD [Burkholderiaceae bacterium]
MASLMRNKRRSRRTMNEINMVPFIDVMLVLLIIFMVTAPLITPSMIELPTVGQAPRQPDRVIQVLVSKDASLQVRADKQTVAVDIKDLAQRVLDLANQNRSTRDATANSSPTQALAVVISADKAVKYEAVVDVMDTLQRAGLSRVALSVNAER